VIACFAALLTILGTVFSPETYAPVLLRQRAARLAKFTGKVYIAQPDAGKPKVPPKSLFANQMKKPWELLFKEPIVLLMALYMAIIYAILYVSGFVDTPTAVAVAATAVPPFPPLPQIPPLPC
jgi:hypothetical protein